MKRRFIPLALFVALTGGHVAVRAAELPDETAEGWHWKLQSVGKADSSKDFEITAREGGQLLVWDDGKQAQYADYVILLVSAPFERVQSAVQTALAPLGTFRSDSAGAIANLSASWKKLWMSRHPELKASASDVLRRITYSSWSAYQVRKSGFANRYTSELYVGVADRTMVFDHPATIVVLSRRDTRPDPKYSFFKGRHLAIGGLGMHSAGAGDGTAYVDVVPGSVFAALQSALTALHVDLDMAAMPGAWLRGEDRYPIALPRGGPIHREYE